MFSKFYKEGNELVLDLGAYTTALEYACDVKAIIMGKPSKDYFSGCHRFYESQARRCSNDRRRYQW